MSEIQRIEDRLRRAFEGRVWHGPAVRELLADVTAARAIARPLSTAHSLWEIVLRMATWEGSYASGCRAKPLLIFPLTRTGPIGIPVRPHGARLFRIWSRRIAPCMGRLRSSTNGILRRRYPVRIIRCTPCFIVLSNTTSTMPASLLFRRRHRVKSSFITSCSWLDTSPRSASPQRVPSHSA